jgi:hypothetical protein
MILAGWMPRKPLYDSERESNWKATCVFPCIIQPTALNALRLSRAAHDRLLLRCGVVAVAMMPANCASVQRRNLSASALSLYLSLSLTHTHNHIHTQHTHTHTHTHYGTQQYFCINRGTHAIVWVCWTGIAQLCFSDYAVQFSHTQTRTRRTSSCSFPGALVVRATEHSASHSACCVDRCAKAQAVHHRQC